MGEFWGWVFRQGPQMIESGGIMVGLLFTGLALRADVRSRHADILMRLTESHRSLWMYHDEHPELRRIFDREADLKTQPMTDREARFIQYFINHVVVTFRTQKLGIYVSPDKLDMDLQDFFSWPVPRAAWQQLQRFQDRDFAAYITRLLAGKAGRMT